VHYLLEAWRKLQPGGDVELWLVGRMSLASKLLEKLPGRVVVRPSVPRPELFDIYRRAGILVFPSLCEGFGMVITEAMANGLPVITTCNTAGPDLIEAGKNGFLVPIRDSERLAETMQWCLDHRDDVFAMGRAAAATVARWQWSDYRAALGGVVSKLMSDSFTEMVVQ
jgi:glycosyltransferase involved in cell wall biosynthesis